MIVKVQKLAHTKALLQCQSCMTFHHCLHNVIVHNGLDIMATPAATCPLMQHTAEGILLMSRAMQLTSLYGRKHPQGKRMLTRHHQHCFVIFGTR